MNTIHKRIKAHREAKGYSQNYLADALGLSINEYFDIELHDDELLKVIKLSIARRLCQLLDIDILDLVGISCPFCDLGFDAPRWRKPRHDLCRMAREETNKSVQEIAAAIGYYEIAVTKFESREDVFDSWPIAEIIKVANVLKIPPQLLMVVKCQQCNH